VLCSQVVDLFDEVSGFMAVFALRPLAAITNAPFFVVDSNGAALGDALVSASLNRLLEEVSRVCTVVDAQTVVQAFEIDAMFESAVLCKIFRRNLGIVARHAHSEAEVNSRVGIETGCTELNRISKALRGAMHADNTVVVLSGPIILSATVGYISHPDVNAYFPM
jgi:hypothetical protein